jgi:hypothetical protein
VDFFKAFVSGAIKTLLIIVVIGVMFLTYHADYSMYLSMLGMIRWGILIVGVLYIAKHFIQRRFGFVIFTGIMVFVLLRVTYLVQ